MCARGAARWEGLLSHRALARTLTVQRGSAAIALGIGGLGLVLRRPGLVVAAFGPAVLALALGAGLLGLMVARRRFVDQAMARAERAIADGEPGDGPPPSPEVAEEARARTWLHLAEAERRILLVHAAGREGAALPWPAGTPSSTGTR